MIAGQEPPSAALAADKTSVVSAEKTSVASRAKTSVAAAEKTPDISMKSTTPWGVPSAPPRARLMRLKCLVSFLLLQHMHWLILALDMTNVLSAPNAACSS